MKSPNSALTSYSILKFIQAIFMESLNLSEIHFMQTQQNELIPRCFQCQSQTLCMPNHTHAAVAALLYPIYAFAHDTDQSFIGHKTSPAKHNVLGETISYFSAGKSFIPQRKGNSWQFWDFSVLTSIQNLKKQNKTLIYSYFSNGLVFVTPQK